MSVPCSVMTGQELLGEIKKEFNYPYHYIPGLDYEFNSCYGQDVLVKCFNTLGSVCAEGYLDDRDGYFISFGQFSVFLERFIVLPNYSKLCLKLSSESVVVAEISTFPLKVQR